MGARGLWVAAAEFLRWRLLTLSQLHKARRCVGWDPSGEKCESCEFVNAFKEQKGKNP